MVEQTVLPADIKDSGPYKFLDYYTQDDKAKYAGRDRDIKEIIPRILKERVFVLYGRSGLGKTSLLLAGIFPVLKSQGFNPIYIRTLDSPTQDLINSVTGKLCSTEEYFFNTLQEKSKKMPVVLVMDQFEEFFIRFKKQKSEQEHFIQIISKLVNDLSLDLRIVFSLREDYLAGLDDFRYAIPSLFDNEYRLLGLSAFGARQAIVQPLTQANISFDQHLIVRLVDELALFEFDPPLLQIICTEVYRAAHARCQNKKGLLQAQDLDNIGGLDGIFLRYLDDALAAIAKQHHLLVRVILDALITQERTKQAVKFEFFINLDFYVEEKEIVQVLEHLVKHRLIREEQRGENSWYELVHERLVDIVIQWMDLDREFFNYRVARDQIITLSRGEQWRDQPESLLPGGTLDDVIGPYKERFRLNDSQLEFVFRSAIYRNARDVGFWSTQFGHDKSNEILKNLLGSKNQVLRQHAAENACHLLEPDNKLIDLCLRLAINDQEESIRRASGLSFAKLATVDQMKNLKTALNNKFKRKRALEVLADILVSEGYHGK